MKKISVPILFSFVMMSFFSCSQNKSSANNEETLETQKTIEVKKDLSRLQIATFASGCFWCVEGVYESVIGVEEAMSGYSGGETQNPTYRQVGSGSTGHAEAVQVYYDSTLISYADLIKVYFASQDITQVNGQGPDIGSQYRSIIFYSNDQERQIAQNAINELNASGTLDSPVAAELIPFEKFWPAEDYHQNYIKLHPNETYVVYESIPRIKRFQKQLPDLIKPDHKL